MKKIIMIVMISFVLTGIGGCKESTSNQKNSNYQEVTKLNTFEEKFSYSIGVNMGEYLKKMENESEEKLDRNAFFQAINDMLDEKESMMSQAEIQEIHQIMSQKGEEKMAQTAAKNKEKGEKFLEENSKKEGIVTTESGLQYQIIKNGEGEKPQATDQVEVHYAGTTIDGKEFDSSYKRGQPVEFPLNQVISGWTEGVQLMSVGSKYKFFIPSDLAYGEQGAGGAIGPNETLIFEVELLSIK